MARGRPTGKVAGNVTAFKADSEFLGAEDIMGRGDVRIRIVVVLTYPKGYMVGGQPKKRAFPVIVYERLDHDGRWVTGSKRWIPESKAVRQALIIRAESVHAPDWRGLVVDLFADVTRSFAGGKTWGVRVRPTPDELDPATLEDKMRRAAARLPPDQREPEQTREPGEDDEPPEQDSDTTEPPEGWQPGDAP